MPKTEAELRDWVVEHNRLATHNRGLSSNYGYNAILDVDLVAVCRRLHRQFPPPIRVLDVGCGEGFALRQLAEQLDKAGIPLADFEFWGIGVNRYEQMWIDQDRFVHCGFYDHDFGGDQFHLIISVFAFHYLWHKLEALEKIHNVLLYDGGQCYVHFPGYLIRFGESLEMLTQDETSGNRLFQSFLDELAERDAVCPMQYRLIPHYSDDDDCSLLAEFGHLRFQKSRSEPISFGHALQAFGLFETGFSFSRMNKTQRVYVASHYQERTSGEVASVEANRQEDMPKEPVKPPPRQSSSSVSHDLVRWHPYRIARVIVRDEVNSPTGIKPLELDFAIHGHESDTIVIVCPGACEPLEGRIVKYSTLAESILAADLGACVRYSDPYDHEGVYAELLLEKLRLVIDFTLGTAEHICGSPQPKLKVMAYSSSAGAAATVCTEYGCIDSLLLIAPSYDVPRSAVLPHYRDFTGSVHVLVGENDQVILPQQAFWYYEVAEKARAREYVEVPCCGHTFAGPLNKAILMTAARWAFGTERPPNFPAACPAPSEAWA